MPRRNYQRRTAGPGRPRKYGEDLKKFQTPVPESTHDDLYTLKEELNVPFAELLTWLVQLAKGQIDKLELLAKAKHQEEYIKRLEKENRALLEEREKLLTRIEKLELEIEALKRGGKVTATRMTKVLNQLVEVLEEGKTFADTMIEIGIELPQEQREVLAKLFAWEGKQPSVLKPLRNIKKLKGWLLVKEDSPDMLNYVWTREDTLKASQSVKPALPKPKAGQPTVEVPRARIERMFASWFKTYVMMENDPRQRSRAQEYVKSIANNGIRRLISEYGFEAVAEVVGSNADFRALFGPFLLKLQEKKLEVKADAPVEACDF